jgi:hypothetical protein
LPVVTLSRRYPGEGGIYLWTRRVFGDAHGFLSGWCYWTNNLFYVPVLLRVHDRHFRVCRRRGARGRTRQPEDVCRRACSLAWLAFITLVNVRGMAAGKWIQNVGGLSAFGSVAIVIAAAMAACGKRRGRSGAFVAAIQLGDGDQLRGHVQRAGRHRARVGDGR